MERIIVWALWALVVGRKFVGPNVFATPVTGKSFVNLALTLPRLLRWTRSFYTIIAPLL